MWAAQSCSITNTIDDKLQAKINETLDKPTDIFGKPKPQPTTEVLFVFDKKPDILNTTSIGEQLQGEFESVLGTVNAVLGGNGTAGAQTAAGVQTSLDQQAAAAVSGIAGAPTPGIQFLLDGLEHNLP